MSTSSRATRASRTGARLTPKRWASSRSVGRRSPARYSPSLMTDLSWSIIWTYNFLDLIGVTGTLRLLGLHIAWLPGCQTSLPPLSGHLLLETEFSNFLLLYDNVRLAADPRTMVLEVSAEHVRDGRDTRAIGSRELRTIEENCTDPLGPREGGRRFDYQRPRHPHLIATLLNGFSRRAALYNGPCLNTR